MAKGIQKFVKARPVTTSLAVASVPVWLLFGFWTMVALWVGAGIAAYWREQMNGRY